MKARSLLRLALAFVVVAGAAYLYAMPYLAFDQLKTAAEKGDERALSRLVDFSSLRDSIRGEVRAEVQRRMSLDGPASSMGGLSGLVAGGLTARVTNALVSPHAIASMVQGGRPLAARLRSGPVRDGAAAQRAPVAITRGYETPSRFVVRVADQATGTARVSLVMRRSGWAQWRLDAVRFGR